VEVVASLSQGRTAAAQCGLFTHKSVPVIFEPPCIYLFIYIVPCPHSLPACNLPLFTILVAETTIEELICCY